MSEYLSISPDFSGDNSGTVFGGLQIENLLDALSEGTLVINKNKEIVFVNKRLNEIFGYSGRELIGKNLSVLIPSANRAIHETNVNNFINDPQIRPMGIGKNLTGNSSDGKEIPLEISLSYVKKEESILIFAFVTDISLRKKAEDELKERNRELDDFAHTIAHDLKSILLAVIGYSEILLKDDDIEYDEQKDILKQVIKGGRKMNTIINEILLFASTKKEDIKTETIDMHYCMLEAVERIKYFAQDKNTKINYPKDLPDALGYSAWIEEVWYNFLTNAIKYGGTPPSVEIFAEVDGNFIKYSVKDNGKGIDERLLSGIFDDKDKMPLGVIKGHGLGLTIVSKIIKKLNGKVEAANNPEGGSTFSFYLPK